MRQTDAMEPFRDRFAASAPDYLTYRPTYPDELVDWLVGLPERRVLAWDAGCGSGQLSVSLARGFQRVVASDASARQVASAGVHPRVLYRVARSEASGLPAGVADLVVAAQAAHWFDLDAWYDEVRRVTRPGGHVALVSYGRPELPGALDVPLERFHRDALAPFWPPERRHVEQGYRSLPFPFPEQSAPDLTMTHRWDLAGLLGYVGTWTAVRRLKESGEEAVLDAFSEELARVWDDAGTRHRVRWPLAVRAGVVGG